jgi:exopolysaccharide biosynthesis polyprenyl glycosylphosphotransferase
MGNPALRLRSVAENGRPSPYARMIPGLTATVPHHPCQAATDPDCHRKKGPATAPIAQDRHDRGPSWLRYLIPQPQALDRFALYRLIAADLVILCGACFFPGLFSPAWRLPADAMPVYLVLVTLFGFSEQLYQDQGFKFPMASVTKSVMFATLLIYLGERDESAWPAFPATFASSLAGLYTWRRLRVRRWNRHKNSDPRNVLIVGANRTGRAIARALREDELQHVVVTGFLDDHHPISAEVLGRIEDLAWLARSEFIDEVILALPNSSSLAQDAAEIAYRNHLDIRAVPDLPAGVWPEVNLDRIGDVPVVVLHREAIPSVALFLKRLLDVSGALVGLLLSLPIMAAVALAIRLESTGPIFYAAERSGAKGRRFRCYKFRSMAIDADEKKDRLRGRNQRQGPIFKIDDDPRVTRVGRLIRRYSLDELPQLWNILRGDMSLVGPRPHPVDDVNRYELHHYRRLDVKPGLTGLWQVTARRNPSFDLNMHLDLTYIENWTLLLDLHILMRTVRVLFAPEGS